MVDVTSRGNGVERGGLAVAEVCLVSGGHGDEAGAFDGDDDLGSAGASALWIGNGHRIGLCLLQRNGLGGLRVRIGHHVGRLPVEVESALCAGIGGKGGRGTIVNGGRCRRC